MGLFRALIVNACVEHGPFAPECLCGTQPGRYRHSFTFSYTAAGGSRNRALVLPAVHGDVKMKGITFCVYMWLRVQNSYPNTLLPGLVHFQIFAALGIE